MVAAGIVVLAAALRTKRRAEKIVPASLLAKFAKAKDDVARIQGAGVLAEELAARLKRTLRRETDDGALG